MASTTTRGASSSEGEPGAKETPYRDVERHATADDLLRNTTVRHLSWSGVTVTVKDRKTKQPKTLVDNAEGYVEAGEMLALMGPSGCGKTTLLNALANTTTTTTTTTTNGSGARINGATPTREAARRVARFVEQEDALTGALTVRETLRFAARLAGGGGGSAAASAAVVVEGLLDAFGLRLQADTMVGTPLRRGLSGGQKRRLGIAGQLITGPRVLFLDEPTSGLDSAAGFEVVRYLRSVARRNKLIVIASIHQPSTSTFHLFDKLLLLAGGQTQYFGPLPDVVPYLASIGRPVPLHVNPAEFLLEQLSVDFAAERSHAARRRLRKMQQAWVFSARAERLARTVAGCQDGARAAGQGGGGSGGGGDDDVSEVVSAAGEETTTTTTTTKPPSFPSLVLTLLHRSFIKSYRDVIAYGVRAGMYLGLALMMGTVWLRLGTGQEYIQAYVNAIFFGGAFMSFMAVAYVPAFLEDRAQYRKEHRNGLYGPGALVLSNLLVGLPYQLAIALGFSAISYFLSGFRATAPAFLTWVLWLFLDLVAAESLVVALAAAAAPSFVVALALVAFANGLWMCVNGFLVSPAVLNGFYRYGFSYWDYQKYVFEGMMVNEFAGRVYECAEGCRCLYASALESQCLIAGEGVLAQYGYEAGYLGKNVGVMIGIIAGYRMVAWLVLMWRR